MDGMKAVICTKYGPPDVLQIRDVQKPMPKANELLIRVRATSVHIGDTKIRRLQPGMGPLIDVLVRLLMRFAIGFARPRRAILGMELAGDVDAVGKDVTRFRPGDAVFASTELRLGAYAEYCCLPENGAIALKPENLSYDEAAPVANGCLTALVHLRRLKIQKGHKALIYGASGSVGTFAIQLARYFGAEVTAVCSASNIELAKSLGALRVIDYTHEDFAQSGEKYDLIYDAVGKIPRKKRKAALARSGAYLSVFSPAGNLKLKADDLKFIRELYENGQLRTVIDRRYPIDQIVEAHRYVDGGHKKGHVVITV